MKRFVVSDSEIDQTRVVKLKKLRDGTLIQGCDVYIGRAVSRGPWTLGESQWGNPFNVKAYGGSVEAVLAAYEKHVRASPKLMADLPLLKNKTLGCWCKDKPTTLCHGDVLVKLVREQHAAEAARKRARQPEGVLRNEEKH